MFKVTGSFWESLLIGGPFKAIEGLAKGLWHGTTHDTYKTIGEAVKGESKILGKSVLNSYKNVHEELREGMQSASSSLDFVEIGAKAVTEGINATVDAAFNIAGHAVGAGSRAVATAAYSPVKAAGEAVWKGTKAVAEATPGEIEKAYDVAVNVGEKVYDGLIKDVTHKELTFFAKRDARTAGREAYKSTYEVAYNKQLDNLGHSGTPKADIPKDVHASAHSFADSQGNAAKRDAINASESTGEKVSVTDQVIRPSVKLLGPPVVLAGAAAIGFGEGGLSVQKEGLGPQSDTQIANTLTNYKSLPLDDHNATGDLVFAMHNLRN